MLLMPRIGVNKLCGDIPKLQVFFNWALSPVTRSKSAKRLLHMFRRKLLLQLAKDQYQTLAIGQSFATFVLLSNCCSNWPDNLQHLHHCQTTLAVVNIFAKFVPLSNYCGNQPDDCHICTIPNYCCNLSLICHICIIAKLLLLGRRFAKFVLFRHHCRYWPEVCLICTIATPLLQLARGLPHLYHYKLLLQLVKACYL